MISSRGFTLVEVVVSLFFVAVMLTLLAVIVRSSVLVRTSENQGIALSIVRNKLEILRAGGYASLPASGTFSDSLSNTLPPAATAALTVSAYNAKTAQVTATVIWKDPGSAASSTVSLSTLITESGGLP